MGNINIQQPQTQRIQPQTMQHSVSASTQNINNRNIQQPPTQNIHQQNMPNIAIQQPQTQRIQQPKPPQIQHQHRTTQKMPTQNVNEPEPFQPPAPNQRMQPHSMQRSVSSLKQSQNVSMHPVPAQNNNISNYSQPKRQQQ